MEDSLYNLSDQQLSTPTKQGLVSHHQNDIFERKIQTQTLGAIILFLYAKIYWPEAITTISWTYALKAFAEKLNVLKVDDYGITPMEEFAGPTKENFLKNHHTWGCTVYVVDARLKGNISGIPKCEPRSRVGIYIYHYPFNSV